MSRILIIAIVWICLAAPAHAGPVMSAISTIAAALKANAVLAFATRVVVTVAIAAFQQRRLQKQLEAAGQQQGRTGIVTQYTGVGGVTPLSVIVGRYATAGHLEAPPMTWPTSSDPVNMYLTYVIGLGDMPGIVPTGRIGINDQWHSFSTAPESELGKTVDGNLSGFCWFRFRNGQETAADSVLMTHLSAYPDRPWQADMIGRGVPHVIATFKRDQDRFPGEPRLRFEVLGIPLYDPRLDSTVGGVGAQRWGDPSTWAHSANPKVIEYNIHRGMVIDGYGIWGNKVAAADLPLDNWFAAMNACDVLVDDGKGGTHPSYVFGFEWGLDTTPAKIIDEINRSCAGETVEIGGIYKTRVGGVGLPVYFFTDDDVIVTRRQELEPFVGLDATFNALSCTHVDPELVWQSREAPPLTNATWEAEDGQIEFDEDLGGFARRPRRLLKQIALPGVSDPLQVQRLMSSAAHEGRKRRSHVVTLPPEALMLEPLDAVSWTSLHNGFAGKVFDVVMTVDPVTELRPRIGLLEADPADYTVPVYQTYETPNLGGGGATALSTPGAITASERLYRTRPGAGLKVALRLAAARSPSLDVRGYQWQRREGEVWRDLVRSVESDIEIADADLGPWAIRLRAEGTLGKLSDWVTLEFEVQGLAAAPTALTDVSLESAGGRAVLTWDFHPDLDVQEGGHILARFSAHPAPTWENCHTQGWQAAGRSNFLMVPLMPGTYFLRAMDARGNGGPITALSTDGIQAVGFASVDVLQEDDEFSGLKEGTFADEGALYLDGAVDIDDVGEELDDLDWDYPFGARLTGTYSFATVASFAAPRRLRLRAHVVQEPIGLLDDFDTVPDVDELYDWDMTDDANCAVLIEVQLTQDDPAASPVWGDWMIIHSNEVTARGIRARARLTSNLPNFSPRVTELRLYIDEVA